MEKQGGKQTISVLGVDGPQGRSVAAAFLQADYRVRVLARDPHIQAEFAQAGAEVHGDVELAELSPRLYAFFAGADLAFLCTSYWQHYYGAGSDAQRQLAALLEFRDGKNAIEACAIQRVPRVFLSAAESPLELSNGQCSVPHWDYKVVLQNYAECRLARITSLYLGFFMENLLELLQSSADDGWELPLGQGQAPLALFCCSDLGPLLLRYHELEQRGERVPHHNGCELALDAEALTRSEICAKLGAHLGKPVRCTELSAETLHLAPMLQYLELCAAQRRDCGFGQQSAANALHTSLTTLDLFLSTR